MAVTLVKEFLFSYFSTVVFSCLKKLRRIFLKNLSFTGLFILCKKHFGTKEDKSETNPWSIVLCCSLHPTQPFFYITESGFSHLKRRLLHFPACLSLLKLCKRSLAFSCCATLKRGDQEGRKAGAAGGWGVRRGGMSGCAGSWI